MHDLLCDGPSLTDRTTAASRQLIAAICCNDDQGASCGIASNQPMAKNRSDPFRACFEHDRLRLDARSRRSGFGGSLERPGSAASCDSRRTTGHRQCNINMDARAISNPNAHGLADSERHAVATCHAYSHRPRPGTVFLRILISWLSAALLPYRIGTKGAHARRRHSWWLRVEHGHSGE
jgi:hypothetical protein